RRDRRAPRRGALADGPARRGAPRLGRGAEDRARERVAPQDDQKIPAVTRGWLVAAAAVLVLAAGCAPVEVRPPQGALDFDLLGRIAARYGQESFTGNVSWRHARGGD